MNPQVLLLVLMFVSIKKNKKWKKKLLLVNEMGEEDKFLLSQECEDSFSGSEFITVI